MQFSHRPTPPALERTSRFLGSLAPFIGVFAAMVFLGFAAGGFFPGAVGVATLGAALALLIWVTVAAYPFGALSLPLVVMAAALSLLAVWTLASASWSEAEARAVLEFDRVVLYLLVTLLAGFVVTTVAARRRLLWGLVAGATLLCGVGLASWLFPDTGGGGSQEFADRLSHPVTYWNTLGLLGTFALIGGLHLAASDREPLVVRVLAAASMPLTAVTLFFTFSRGSMAALAVGVLAYLVLARPRGLVGAAIAVVPTTAAALVAAYGADVLSTVRAATAAGADEGRSVALVLACCIVAAAVLRVAAVPLDRRVAALRVPRPGRRQLAAGGAALAVVLLAGFVLAGGPAWVERQGDRFVEGNYVSNEGDRRDRLVQLGNNGRLEHWRVAIEAFEREPLRGTGAGTYELEWAQHRPDGFTVLDGHSLYAEIAGELGIVGLLLMLALVVSMLVAAARRARGPDRAVGAAAFALILTWAIHAGIDWDWEMPVVTLPILMLGAAVASRTRDGARAAENGPRNPTRIVIALGVLALAATPALAMVSQEHLEAAVGDLKSGDCAAAVDRALSATEALPARPEPFEILGYCDVRLGRADLAVKAMAAAVERDPRNWRVHYGMAVVSAAAGQDPRTWARTAVRLNPYGEIARDGARRFRGEDPRTWRRRATKARLPF